MASKSPVSQFLAGLSCYLRVPGVLFRHGLWPYQLLPAVLSLVLTLLLIVGFYFLAAGFAGWIDGVVVLSIGWLDAAVHYTLAILVFLLLVAGFLFLHKHVVLILLAPFLGKIAEETLRALEGERFQDSGLNFGESLARGARINLRYILREFGLSLLFLVFGFLPVIGSLVSATGLFVTQARFLGYGLMDFPLENRGLSVDESDTFVHKRRSLSVGIGAGYILLMAIPLVGWMFAPTFGTVAGTLRSVEELDRD